MPHDPFRSGSATRDTCRSTHAGAMNRTSWHGVRAAVVAAIVTTAALLVGCGGLPPATNSGTTLTVTTSLPVSSIGAGESIAVTCVLGGDEAARGEVAAFAIEWTPNPDSEVAGTASGAVVTFTPELAGAFVLHCRALDAEGGVVAEDAQGAPLEVLATAPAAIETLLLTDVAYTCDTVELRCVFIDRFGNEAGAASAASGASVAVVSGQASVRVEPAGDAFDLVALPLGSYALACQAAGLVDASPAPLEVVVGPAAATDTSVSAAVVGPAEAVTVTCTMVDACGNAVPGSSADSASFDVCAADGSSQQAAGVTRNGASFSATRAGTYLVECFVPPGSIGDPEPAVVTVHPGLPHSLVVDAAGLEDERCFDPAQPLSIFYSVLDAYGNGIPDCAMSIEANGVLLQANEAGQYFLPGDGEYDLVLEVLGEVDPDTAMTPAVVSLRADGTPPIIDITRPRRAASIQGGTTGDSSVTIEGSVFDSMGTVSAFELDGVAHPGAVGLASYAFAQEATSRWGLNIIEAHAIDDCGNERFGAQSYLRSPSYFAAATAPAAGGRVPAGVVARLEALLIDDGDREDVDDLATLANAVMGSIDLAASLPDPLVVTPDVDQDHVIDTTPCFCGLRVYQTGYKARVTGDIAYSSPQVTELAPVNGGLSLGFEVADLSLPLSLQATYKNCLASCISGRSVQTTVQAVLNVEKLTAAARLGVNAASGEVVVDLCEDCLDVDYSCPPGSDSWCPLDVDWGLLEDIGLGDLLNWITNGIMSSFKDQILSLLKDELRRVLTPLVAQMLQSFTLDTALTLPAPLSLTVHVNTGVDSAAFCGTDIGLVRPSSCPPQADPGFGRLGISAQAYPAERGVQIPADAVGAIRRDGMPPTFAGATAVSTFALALKDDLINQVLWAIWYGGGLDFALADVAPLVGGGLPLAGIDVSLSAKSPPVLMPTDDGSVEIGIGDVEIEGTVDIGAVLGKEPGVEIIGADLYASGLVRGTIDLDPATNTLLVALDPQTDLWVELVSTSDPAFQRVLPALIKPLLDAALPKVLEQMVMSFAIPDFDLGTIPGLPAGVFWRTHNGQLERVGDYHIVSGSLQ